MTVKTIIDERFDDYKLPVMFIGTASCDGKCCKEAGLPMSICQNDAWRSAAAFVLGDEEIIERYLSNPITSAVCFGGLEPFEQFVEMFRLISKLRLDYECDDAVIIYTGYNKDELLAQTMMLKPLKNIIIKFGRYIPKQSPHYDEVLGVKLASPNQYAEQIS